LSAQAALLFLLGGGHAHHAQGAVVAADIPVEGFGEGSRIAFIGFDLLAVFVPVAGTYDEVLCTEGFEFAVQAVSKRTRLVAGVYFLGQSELLLHPLQQPFSREALSGLRGLTVDLSDSDLAVGMNIEAQEDDFGLGGCLLLTYSVLRHDGQVLGVGLGSQHSGGSASELPDPAPCHL
jgi:hypothetical protein